MLIVLTYPFYEVAMIDPQSDQQLDPQLNHELP